VQKELEVREQKYTVSLLTILVTMAVGIHVAPLTRRLPGLEAGTLAMKLDTGPVNRSSETVPAPDNAMKLGDDGFAAAIVLNGRPVSITELSRQQTAEGRTRAEWYHEYNELVEDGHVGMASTNTRGSNWFGDNDTDRDIRVDVAASRAVPHRQPVVKQSYSQTQRLL
jgi:hypothetical protein